MKTVKIAKLKDELSSHVRAVEAGASFIVTDRDRPVARLSPILEDDGFELIAAQRPFASARRRRFPPTRSRVDSLALLLLERTGR